MSMCRSEYQGDEALAGLLAKHGVPGGLARVRHVLSGVNAAMLDEQDEAWIGLITADPSPALAAQLLALKQQMAGDKPAEPTLAERVALLRAELKRRNLAGFIIPRADQHQGEYVPACAQRLGWLTGFTGSAGSAIVLTHRAAMFVDGRYTIQVRQQVDTTLFETLNSGEVQATDWLAGAVAQGERIGIDPWLHTQDQIDKFATALDKIDAEMVELDSNPVDAIWAARPPLPLGPVRLQSLDFAGASSSDKRAQVAAELQRQKTDAAILSAPDSIAWLLNVRGSDVESTPLPLSFTIVHTDGALDWFVERDKLLPEIAPALGNQIAIRDPDSFTDALKKLGKAEAKVVFDASGTSAAIPKTLKASGATPIAGSDPCLLPKAIKNAVELAGTRAAHGRDGVALTRFLAWVGPAALKGGLSETAASDHLEALRRENDLFRDLSFPTISGAGSDGAIVHYRATRGADRTLAPGELYLVDSGAQYQDGTTDVTRTVAIGTPNDEQRDRFTRVLKGHIALATARFPAGTSGMQLDVLARRALWDVGLDYDHGTGHGVGSYLSVHEGPQRIAKIGSSVPLKPGMILSNEPGYYKTGAYGIRIENLVIVTRISVEGAEREMLGFETLTLAPIDLNLVEPALLTVDERAWLNAYHARVKAEIGPKLTSDEQAWLETATRPI